MKKAYTIVFYEKSAEEFRKRSDVWILLCCMQCDSGVKLNHLQEFYFIALDVFNKIGHAKSRNKDDRLAGWLSLLCTEDADEAAKLEEKDREVNRLKRMLAKNNMLHDAP